MNNKKMLIIVLTCVALIAIVMLIPNYLYATGKVLLGDINKDGNLDSLDLLYMTRHISANGSEKHSEWLLKDDKLKLADITQNGDVNSSDMLAMLRYIAASNNPEEIGSKHREWLQLKEVEIEDAREKNTVENISVNEIEVQNETVEEPENKVNEIQEETSIGIKSIKLNKSAIEIEKGKTEQIIATIEPKELSNEKIEWKIANREIAEVDETGKITGKKNGETIVIARTANGKEATSKVRVGTYPESIVINKEEVKIDLSEKRTEKIDVKVEPEDASNKEVKIENSNEKVATIDGEGKITGKENGETELTFKTANGIEKKIKVKVETSETGIKLDRNYVQLDLSQNKQTTIKATVEPSTASNKEITYTSSNEAIVTVDNNGKVTAKGNGTANIIAKTANGKEAVCKVEVQTVATKINMDKNVSIDLSKEKEKKIKIEVEPEEAKNKSVMIRSSNEEVATIDSKGTIKAKKNGETIITAEIAGTDIRETCKVLVTTSPTGLKISKTNVSLDMSGTKSIKLTAEVEPSTASNKKIKWTNGNSDIVYVSATGENATITGLKNGEALITAEIEGTNIKKTCKATVTTSPASIKLNKTSASLDMSGTKTVQLTATVAPSTAQNKTITWSSSNKAIATVDNNGKVTAKKNGTITITAKTNNGKLATCKVTVKGEDIITNIPIGEKIARFAAQISGYATGSVSSGGPHWPGWYPNSGNIFLHTGTGGTAKEYPNIGIGINNYKELPNNLKNLHDFWYVQDMTGRYPYKKKLYKTYWGKSFAYAGMWPPVFATYRATYDPLFNHTSDYLDSAVKKGAFTKITTTFAKLDSVAKPGDFIGGGNMGHCWIWIGNKIVKQYWKKAPSTAKMLTASGQEGRWPNIVNSHYGCWNGNVKATIYRPTGKVKISSSAPLVIDLNKYGLENSNGFDKKESIKRQEYCDKNWPHLSHK